VPKKRCRTFPAEGVWVYPQTKNPPRLGDLGVDYDFQHSVSGVFKGYNKYITSCLFK